MTNLLPPLTAALDRHALADVLVVVAVSGGADSTALLRGLVMLRDDRRLRLVAAHLDHALRDDSADDARWVQQLCDRFDVPLHTRRVDVAAVAAERRTGLEETARDLRRTFLAEVARETGAKWVALAHTADDQAETILHRLVRGSGLRGLAGIAERSPLWDGIQLIRPLLGVSRADIEAWLRELGQDWRVDASNADPGFTRNRIRHELLPLLRRDFNPRVDDILRRLGEQARETADLVESLAAEYLSRALRECGPERVQLDVTEFASLPRHLVREVGALLWRRQNWPAQPMTFDHWDRLAGLMSANPAGPALSLPGFFQATRTGTRLEIERR